MEENILTINEAGIAKNSFGQLLVVMSDDVVAASREAERVAKAQKSESLDWRKAIRDVGLFMTNPIVNSIVGVAREAYSAWVRANQDGLDIQQISISEAKNISFPPGHPRLGVLYIKHPASANVFYTMAAFHRMAFEHKFAEVTELLMHLGATKVTVEHVRGWSSEFAGGLSAAIPKNDVEFTVKSNSSSHSLILFEASLSGSNNPVLPKSQVWYQHEPTWQSIAKGRISFGLKQFSLSLNYEDDFGVHAGLKNGAQKAGLEIGGDFERHEATTWKIYGEFK